MLEIDIEKRLSSFTLKVKSAFDGAVSIVGPSGSGKSVTLKCIAGIMRPDHGFIAYNGRVLFDSERHIDLPPQKRNVGYLFQSYALFPDMSVRKNIEAGIMEKSRKARREKAEETAAMLHIGHILESKPHEISGGEAQRTALARMIASNPCLMLFDEPFSALDVYLKEEIKAEFRSIIKSIGKDYIIVTHSMSEAYSLSEHMLMMDQGRIIREGKTGDVFANPLSGKAASIMGYRNIVKAEDKGGKIHVPEWNITLDIPFEGAEGVCIMDSDIIISNEGIKARAVEHLAVPDAELFSMLPEGAVKPVWVKTRKGMAIPEQAGLSFMPGAIRILKEL